VSGGFLFGGLVGGAAALVGATAGASIIFVIAKRRIRRASGARAGPLAEKLPTVSRRCLPLLMFLRLVPVFPFSDQSRRGDGRRPSADIHCGDRIGSSRDLHVRLCGRRLDSVIRAQARSTMPASPPADRLPPRLRYQGGGDTGTAGALAALGVIALIPVA
jgi:hypothetical protein